MKKVNFSTRFLMGLCIASMTLFSACSDSDDNNKQGESSKETGNYFVSVSGESDEYLMQLENVNEGSVDFKQNFKQLDQSGYTWIFSPDHKHAVGLIYKQGDAGIGLGYQMNENGSFYSPKSFQITNRFTTYGFFENYALAGVSGQTYKDKDGKDRNDGVTFTKINLENWDLSTTAPISTLNVFKEGELASFAGIVDRGDGTFLTGAVVSTPKDEATSTGGSSSGVITDPNKVYVAIIDDKFEIKKVITDDRISFSSGRHRSQYYSQIGLADDKTAYVFSGAYAGFDNSSNLPAGVLKINAGADEFDKEYYFNIEEKSGGLKFKRLWHITGNKFLLEMYNEVAPEKPIMAPTSQYAIVDVQAKTYHLLTPTDGIPAKDTITSTGLPSSINGKMYFPITTTTNSAIYILDPATNKVEKGSVFNVSKVNAVGYITK